MITMTIEELCLRLNAEFRDTFFLSYRLEAIAAQDYPDVETFKIFTGVNGDKLVTRCILEMIGDMNRLDRYVTENPEPRYTKYVYSISKIEDAYLTYGKKVFL